MSPLRSKPVRGRRRLAIAAFVVAAAALPPLIMDRSGLEDYSRTFVLVLAVLGVSVLTGTTGLISLGHAVFVAIGAFSMANLLDAGMPVIIALPVATGIAATPPQNSLAIPAGSQTQSFFRIMVEE